MSALDSLIFALSGSFEGYTKKDVEGLIANNGGAVKSTVTKAVTHLITTTEDYLKKTAKVGTATANGIPIVTIAWLEDSIKKGKKQAEGKYDPGKPAKASSSKAAAAAPAPKATAAKATTSKAAAAKAVVPKLTRAPSARAAAAAAAAAASQSSQTAAPAPQTTTITGKKRGRKAANVDDDEEEEEEEEEVKPAKGKGKAKAKAADTKAKVKAPAAKKRKAKKEESEDEEMDEEEEEEEEEEDKAPVVSAEEAEERERQKGYKAPVDEMCGLRFSGFQVYEDKDNVKYDASLNQTNIGNNNNKFYVLQLINKGSSYAVWTRWGRVGEHGQNKLMSNLGLDGALKEFNKKFKDKTGVVWDERLKADRPGKYTYLEKDYAPPDEETKKPKKEDAGEVIESKLPLQTQIVANLIFNKDFIQQSMADLNYDAKKLPLGRLNKNTIARGYAQLKAIGEALNAGTSNRTVFEQLTNSYYSTIPHSFGRDRPTVINSDRLLKAEIDLVQSLGDMAIAEKIMKDVEYAEDDEGNRIHPLDKQFASLGLLETTPLEEDTKEFEFLRDYFHKTHGQTHTHIRAKVVHIFRIERKDERDIYAKESYHDYKSDNRRLLWHGSRATNFAGILSQGLRIAPPEAPVNGYMFGKGVYLADISTKSAGYCVPSISGHMGLMLLCEAQLGDPMYELTNADYYAAENSKKAGCMSTFGKGKTAPKAWMDAGEVHEDLKGVQMPNPENLTGDSNVKGAYLQYNEYICYSTAQIKLRYLFYVDFH